MVGSDVGSDVTVEEGVGEGVGLYAGVYPLPFPLIIMRFMTIIIMLPFPPLDMPLLDMLLLELRFISFAASLYLHFFICILLLLEARDRSPFTADASSSPVTFPNKTSAPTKKDKWAFILAGL